MRARVIATLNTGDKLDWTLRDTSYQKLAKFLEVAKDNEPRIVNFDVNISLV